MKSSTNSVLAEQQGQLVHTLKSRFEQNPQRHGGMEWDGVQAKLESLPDKVAVLTQMELTGGEPDVVGYDEATGEYIFYDCAPESPTGRRSFCYDGPALEARKQNKPQNSAVQAATAMGITLLTETEYRNLQQLGEFDKKTSSWLATPASLRDRGGALFGELRYSQVFVYHNGADSYYAVRGFRGSLRL